MARILADSVDMPSAATRVQLSTVDEHVITIMFKGTALNKGLVHFGDKNVSASAGFSLEPGESAPLPASLYNQVTGIPHTVLLSSIWVVAVNAGDDIEYWAFVT